MAERRMHQSRCGTCLGCQLSDRWKKKKRGQTLKGLNRLAAMHTRLIRTSDTVSKHWFTTSSVPQREKLRVPESEARCVAQTSVYDILLWCKGAGKRGLVCGSNICLLFSGARVPGSEAWCVAQTSVYCSLVQGCREARLGVWLQRDNNYNSSICNAQNLVHRDYSKCARARARTHTHTHTPTHTF